MVHVGAVFRFPDQCHFLVVHMTLRFLSSLPLLVELVLCVEDDAFALLISHKEDGKAVIKSEETFEAVYLLEFY